MKIKNSLVNGLVIASLLLSNLVWVPGAAMGSASDEPLAPSQGDILYVIPGGTGDCTSWASACELKPALSAATPGDEIWTQQGVYKPDFWENLTDFTFVAWVNWDGGANQQRIFDFGRDTNNFMTLNPRGFDGRMHFEMWVGGAVQGVYGGGPLPMGSWQHVAVTLSGSTGNLYLNGNLLNSATITYDPW